MHKWFLHGGYEEDEWLSQLNGNWSSSEIYPNQNQQIQNLRLNHQ